MGSVTVGVTGQISVIGFAHIVFQSKKHIKKNVSHTSLHFEILWHNQYIFDLFINFESLKKMIEVLTFDILHTQF